MQRIDVRQPVGFDRTLRQLIGYAAIGQEGSLAGRRHEDNQSCRLTAGSDEAGGNVVGMQGRLELATDAIVANRAGEE